MKDDFLSRNSDFRLSGIALSYHRTGDGKCPGILIITIIAKCRNVCAHGERLFDFHTTDMIPDTLLHSKLGIPCKKGLYQNGKKDLFAVVIALRYLISDNEFKVFRRNLALLIKDVLKKCPHLTEDQLLKEMGFPKNWAKITRYKK